MSERPLRICVYKLFEISTFSWKSNERSVKATGVVMTFNDYLETPTKSAYLKSPIKQGGHPTYWT